MYYLALGRKSALIALYKATKDDKMVDFMSKNFMEQRWKRAAAKNAFVLQGKHRYMLAAAFFILSGDLKDCLSVCLRKLDDPQLALCVSRLVEGEVGDVTRQFLTSQIMPVASKTDPVYGMKISDN